MIKNASLLCAVALSFPTFASAAEDEEAMFDESVRNFGFTSGAAHQCAGPAKRPEIESDALRAFSGLVRLFGSDHAFMYAAAFGAGSTMQIDRSKCPEHLASFSKSMDRQAGDKQ